MCVGCRGRATASELLRVVAGSDAEGSPALVPDPDRRAPGRGAHLHPTHACWQLAARRKAFPRALRVGGPLSGVLVEEFLSRTSPTEQKHHRPETGARSS